MQNDCQKGKVSRVTVKTLGIPASSPGPGEQGTSTKSAEGHTLRSSSVYQYLKIMKKHNENSSTVHDSICDSPLPILPKVQGLTKCNSAFQVPPKAETPLG